MNGTLTYIPISNRTWKTMTSQIRLPNYITDIMMLAFAILNFPFPNSNNYARFSSLLWLFFAVNMAFHNLLLLSECIDKNRILRMKLVHGGFDWELQVQHIRFGHDRFNIRVVIIDNWLFYHKINRNSSIWRRVCTVLLGLSGNVMAGVTCEPINVHSSGASDVTSCCYFSLCCLVCSFVIFKFVFVLMYR